MTDQEADAMRAQLEKHYRDRLVTISEFCAALRTWSEVGGKFIEQMAGKVDIEGLFLAAAKSSLLGRLLYGREKLRTKPCPECRGTWRGCFLNCPCGGCGWLPTTEPPHGK